MFFTPQAAYCHESLGLSDTHLGLKVNASIQGIDNFVMPYVYLESIKGIELIYSDSDKLPVSKRSVRETIEYSKYTDRLRYRLFCVNPSEYELQFAIAMQGKRKVKCSITVNTLSLLKSMLWFDAALGKVTLIDS